MILLILGGIFLLGIIIVVHEFGHLLMGRLVGIKAEIFSIGYGKGFIKKKIGDTTFQITMFPLGGYVKFYGDDYFKDYHSELDSKAFFSKPPLVRIIPVLGGPLFNLIFGFIIFLGLGFFPKESPPIINLWEELENTPAKISGLKNGDVVLSINDEAVHNFKEIQEKVILSGGSPLDFKIERLENGQEHILNIKVIPDVDPSGRSSIGIRVPGERTIQVDFPFTEVLKYKMKKFFYKDLEPPYGFQAMKYLEDNDIILEVEGKKISSTLELQRFLGSLEKDKVLLTIKREKYPWLLPWITEEIKIEIPFRKEYRVYLENIKDLKYNEYFGTIVLSSFNTEHLRILNYLYINNEPVKSYENLYEKFKNNSSNFLIRLNENIYEASIKVERIGLMGFRPNNIIDPLVNSSKSTFFGAIEYAIKNTYNNIAIYPKFFSQLFSGRISFIENTMGPVGMFAIAGMIMQTDIFDYFQLMASISIALMIINLIPFPIVDGGHIVLYIIEAIRKKRLSLTVIESMHKLAFVVLMSLGLWIMFKDILFVLGL